MNVHRKYFTRQLVADAMLHASPVPCFVTVMQTTTVITNIGVAGVAHFEQGVAADGYALQDRVDDDDDDQIRVKN